MSIVESIRALVPASKQQVAEPSYTPLRGVDTQNLVRANLRNLDRSIAQLHAIDEEINRLIVEKANTELAIKSFEASLDVLQWKSPGPADEVQVDRTLEDHLSAILIEQDKQGE